MTDSRDDYLGLVVAGWTMAFVLPVGGLVTAFALADRRSGHAAGMAVVSIVSIAFMLAGILLLR